MSRDSHKERATGADVARLAGVSVSTVSYVLNNKMTRSIPETTRQRVRQAALDLGYRPSPAARSLRVGRSDVVIALLPSMEFSITYQRGLRELALALSPAGLSLVVHPVPVNSAGMQQLWKAITPVCVFSFVSLPIEDVEAMRAAGIQVTVACCSGHDPLPWELKLGGDEVGRVQAEHLISTGHTHIGVALPLGPVAADVSADRRAGLLKAMREVGQTRLPVRHLPRDPELAERELMMWMAEEPAMTAIAAWNDDSAALVCLAAARAGVVVPDQLAIIGAYDFPIATLVHPAISSLRVDIAGWMQTIATAIVAVIAGNPLPVTPLGGEPVAVVRRATT